jgi:gas vesicle protein
MSVRTKQKIQADIDITQGWIDQLPHRKEAVQGWKEHIERYNKELENAPDATDENGDTSAKKATKKQK